MASLSPFRPTRYFKMVLLGQLAAATANSNCSRLASTSPARATSMQQEMLDRMRERLDRHGPPPEGLCLAGALSEILATKDLNGEGPAHIAPYMREKLRITKGK